MFKKLKILSDAEECGKTVSLLIKSEVFPNSSYVSRL